MEPLFELSAAPHLPPSLRKPLDIAVRPEVALSSLTILAIGNPSPQFIERNGELYVALPCAA
jgi:hypothetical protein